MVQSHRKIVFWLAGTAAYFFVVAVVLAMLFDKDVTELERRLSLEALAHSDDVQSLIGELETAASLRGVLVPIGPDDSYLPGHPDIWTEMLKVSEVSLPGKDVNGFDGLQAVRNVSELGRGAVSELFISGQPSSVIRVENTLLLLNKDGRIQVIDCEYPRAPVLKDPLPYPPVEKILLAGKRAFLLLKKLNDQGGEMIVLDFSEPDEIQELTRLIFPVPIMNFFFLDGQLLTYENRGGQKQDQYFNLYNLTTEYELQPQVKIKSPVIGKSAILVGHYLVTPDLRDGLNIIDVGDLQQPLPVTTFSLNNQVRKLVRIGDHFFASGPKGQLYVVDVQNLQQPTLATKITGANFLAYYLHVGDFSYYFSDNGYLRVYDTPIAQIPRLKKNKFVPFEGTLAETPSGQGLLYLGDYSNFSFEVAGDSFLWGETTEIVDVIPWREYNVLLDQKGGLSFLATEKDGRLFLEKQIDLPGEYRWLAAGESHLYAGGETVEVVGYSDSGEIAHVAGSASGKGESFDGVVVGDFLFVAAGRKGVRQLSLQVPTHPEELGFVKIPGHLEGLVDARQLTRNGHYLLAAAGSAGLIKIGTDRVTGGSLEAGMIFDEPVIALTTVNNFCLVSDKQSVHVIDLRLEESLQKLGEISFAGVERFVVASNGLWAGYVPGAGWTVLPVPSIMSSTELKSLINKKAFSDNEVARYRLSIFDDQSVVGVPGVLSMAALSEVDLSGTNYAAN